MVISSDLYPTHYNNIDEIYVQIWKLLDDGKKDRNSEFHNFYIASNSNLYPSLRTVILRHIDEEAKTIGFHTDIRSNKINEIKDNSNVSALFYGHNEKSQIRINGNAKINNQNRETEFIWNKINPYSKKCYLVENSPGTLSDIPISGYSLNIEKIQQPELNVVNLGYQNFSYINIEIMNIEWLYLHRNGHRRALYTIKEKKLYEKTWLTP
tara:strand:- start:18 stop:647 length:630 start_codon:yes stop_codon:yes gene_type:complete